MAASKVTIYLFAVLIPLAFVTSQDSTPGLMTIPGMPSFPTIPNFPGIPNFRRKRQAPTTESDGEDRPHQNRFFFHFFGTPTTCDFATEAGRTCRSCTQALNCLANGTGIIRTCHGFCPYCNSGICSPFPGAACTATTTTSTTTTTTTTTAAP